MISRENSQRPTNNFMLLLFSFFNLAWFCSNNVAKTNTLLKSWDIKNYFKLKTTYNPRIQKKDFCSKKRPYWWVIRTKLLKVLRQKVLKMAKWSNEGLGSSWMPIQVDFWRGWRILSHCGGFGGFARKSLITNDNIKNILLSMKLAYSIMYGSV